MSMKDLELFMHSYNYKNIMYLDQDLFCFKHFLFSLNEPPLEYIKTFWLLLINYHLSLV